MTLLYCFVILLSSNFALSTNTLVLDENDGCNLDSLLLIASLRKAHTPLKVCEQCFAYFPFSVLLEIGNKCALVSNY